MKSSCGITDQDICISCLGCCHCIIYDRCRVCSCLSADKVDTCTVCPLCKLLTCCRTEGICCCKDNFLSLIFEFAGKFTNGSCLSYSVDTDHKDHGFLVFECVFCTVDTHLIFDPVDQKLLALCRVLDMLFGNLFFQFLYDC